MDHWRLGHRPALDGLRGIAILLVMVGHTAPQSAVGSLGTAGVTVFFTLSGFLITALLVGERERTGWVRLGAFYLRRARRLLPALVAMLVVVTAVGLVVDDYASPLDALGALGYVANWIQAAGGDLGAFGHTWSLSIEEQFYLAWPLVLIAASRTRHWRGILFGTIAFVWAYAAIARWVLWDNARGAERIYNGTDLRIDALLIGCALAIWMTNRAPRPSPTSGLGADVLLIGMVALIVATAYPPIDYLINPAWIPIAVVVAIRWLVSPSYAGLLAHPLLRYVGKRSYALYLWHVPVVLLLERTTLPHWPLIVVAYTATALLAEASWRYVEQPFLDRKPDDNPANLSHHEQVIAERQSWTTRLLRRLRPTPPPTRGVWVVVNRHGSGPPICDHVPADGKKHRLAWTVPVSPDMEVYVDGERVR